MATIPEALAIAIEHHQGGRLQAAEQIYRQILQTQPNHPDALHLLGMIAHKVGNLEVALEYMRRAITLSPHVADFHLDCGTVLREQGKLDEAAACFRRALKLNPDQGRAYHNLGNVFKEQGKLDEAAACFRRTVELMPEQGAAHNSLGDVFQIQGKLDEAVACFRRALQLKPDYFGAHNNLGNAFQAQGKLDEAAACYRQTLQLNPDYVGARNNLGNVFQAQGKPDEAIACYRRVLQLKPDYVEVHSNLLHALQYCAGVTPAELAKAHAEFDRRHAAPLGDAVSQHENVRDRHGRLRLGFISPDLGQHPVGYFLVRVLENLGQEQHETICYSDRLLKDDLTQRFQAAATEWRDVMDMSDQRLAEQIRADRIDILFDLAGHTVHNRLLVFARKPAPIQITWIGYEGTTGMSAMDYLLADRYMVPEGTERYYREQVLRMPEGYVCFDPPQAAPPVGPLPACEQGAVTFGSFNNPLKITSEVLRLWAEILRRVPQGRLVLKYRGLNAASVEQHYRDVFAGCGVGPERLTLLPSSSFLDYLAAYQQIDIALDPFPFSGSVTTCEALWMGVPVITCPGETFASRHGLSHLSNIGLTETIAHGPEEYVDLAVRLAGDLPRLSALRAGLRQRMAASPLCDGKRFAANLAAVLHDVWEQYKLSCSHKDL